MRYVSATPAIYSRVKTKKDLKEAAKEGFNAEMQVTDIQLGSGIMGINEIPEDMALQVSNAKRSWFATVVTKNGKAVVT